ncbi:thiamine pyrophosphate-binding protein [Azospirillum palustre]|uniref:Thiamine pyrophosphate-binding protein n=1 Tax=Azospirillum palustre TaxID=2044885 RepID=A0A2B8BNY6_9PROT|nr:thiamine pyrophosphate-binding protein [Azospirillum palustre]PGH59132.1 thiamine pyrophosphate-binding protein [Azospirillum palustre]
MNNGSAPATAPATGGRLLVDMLRLNGVDRVFCVPGESYLAVLDALVDAPEIAVTICRHEGGAAMMAEAYGKCTGRPGICFVTRGPGATNASHGVHIAHQDSTPMILFIGQIERSAQEREAFQEVDYRRMYGPLSKWVAQIDEAGRIPEMVGRAFYTATSGRPGPVVLALPEDMLVERAAPRPAEPYRAVEPGLRPEDLAELERLLGTAERPLLLVGGGGWTAEACDDIRRFAEAWDLPVGVSFRSQDLFDNAHPNYAGDLGLGVNPALARTVQETDLLLVVGPRLGEATTGGYTLLDIPCPRQTLVHVHAGVEELGRVYQPALAINAGMRTTARALAALAPPASRRNAERIRERTKAIHDAYLAWTDPPSIPGPLQMGEIMGWLRETLPPDTIVTNGAGNFAIWPNRFHRYRRFRTMLAPTSGSMGYGIPAAIAAKLLHPERPVVAFAGDGCFMMSVQELATAAQYEAAIVVVLVNNGMFGTIRMHQEREYPRRVIGTELKNPDFVTLAQSFGAHAERITRTGEFMPAFERAMAAGRLALLELVIDPEAISPTHTVTSLREQADRARSA